jgi:oligopeptide/dipeptide ABC transporter ATP-binding protein
MRIEQILAEPFHIHGMFEGKASRDRIVHLLEAVGMSERFLKRYPHEFSGGQRQRIGIARALALNPSIVILDEPVSALDVSIQAQTLNLLEQLQREFQLTFLLIAHDLAVVRHAANRVAVMYLGKIVELADRRDLYERPVHPYTQALLSAVPIPDPATEQERSRILLEGEPPSPRHPPASCRFNPRCWKAEDVCRQTEPLLDQKDMTAPGHEAACHFPALIEDAERIGRASRRRKAAG